MWSDLYCFSSLSTSVDFDGNASLLSSSSSMLQQPHLQFDQGSSLSSFETIFKNYKVERKMQIVKEQKYISYMVDELNDRFFKLSTEFDRLSVNSPQQVVKKVIKNFFFFIIISFY